jgi:hypothetical protein
MVQWSHFPPSFLAPSFPERSIAARFQRLFRSASTRHFTTLLRIFSFSAESRLARDFAVQGMEETQQGRSTTSGYSASSSETETTLAGTVDDRGKRRVRELFKAYPEHASNMLDRVTTTGAQNLEHSGTHRRRSRACCTARTAASRPGMRCCATSLRPTGSRATPRHAVAARQDCPIDGTAGAGRRPAAIRAASTRAAEPSPRVEHALPARAREAIIQKQPELVQRRRRALEARQMIRRRQVRRRQKAEGQV